jgi:hypothetical protein
MSKGNFKHNKMKKAKTIFGAFLLTIVILPSCGGPTFCECNDNYGNLSSSDQDKCAKMIDSMTESEIKQKMQKCQNK